MGRSPSVLLPLILISSAASSCVPRPYGALEWVVDPTTGCCIERRFERGDPLPRPYCTCTCDGDACSLNQPVSTKPSNPTTCSDGTSARCATHMTIDLACDSTP